MNPENEITNSEAPQSLYDSAIALGENPAIELGYQWLTEYPTSNNKKEVEPISKEISQYLLNNFSEIDNYLDYWQGVEELATENEDQHTLRKLKNLRNSVYTRLVKSPIDIEQIKTDDDPRTPITVLLEKIISEDKSEREGGSGIYESILGGILFNVEGEKDTVDLLYTLCETAIMMNNDIAIDYVLRLLTYNTEALNPKSRATKYYADAVYSLDDSVLKKASEIEVFLTNLSQFYLSEEEIEHIDSAHKIIFDKLSLEPKLRANRDQDPRKAKLLEDFYISKNEFIAAYCPIGDTLNLEKYPYSVIATDPGTVMQATQHIMEFFNPMKGYRLLHIPKHGSSRYKEESIEETSHEKFRDIIISHMKDSQPDTPHTLNIFEMRTILSHLKGNIENVEDLKQLRETIVTNLSENFVRSLGQRGNEIIITDDNLKSYGFTKLTFKPSSKGYTDVDIHLGNFVIPFTLDDKFRLHIPSNKYIVSPELLEHENADNLQCEVWILAHLEELLCKEIPEFTEINLPSGEKSDFIRFLGRSAHLRRMKPGFSPSENRIQIAQEFSGWNLEEINKRRKEQGKLPVTYVKTAPPKENDGSDKPVKMYADSATDAYSKLLD